LHIFLGYYDLCTVPLNARRPEGNEKRAILEKKAAAAQFFCLKNAGEMITSR